jgi:hypothetical protein
VIECFGSHHRLCDGDSLRLGGRECGTHETLLGNSTIGYQLDDLIFYVEAAAHAIIGGASK